MWHHSQSNEVIFQYFFLRFLRKTNELLSRLNFRVEEELRLLGDSADGETSSRRSTTSARRSFFKRIKPQRGSSRDSKELASFSNTHLSLYLDPSTSDDGTLSSYQRVERLECEILILFCKFINLIFL